MDDAPQQSAAGPSVKHRWLAAVAYLGPGFVLGILTKGRSAFLHWHVQQGFVLFFMEMVGIAFILILDETIGRIKLLGFLVMVLVQLGLFLLFLVLSILGFVKSLAGEDYRIPVLDDYAARVPLSEEDPA